VARRYRRFAQIVTPLGAPLERVVLTPRFAWQLRLSSGLNIMLGRDADAAESRLQRFVEDGCAGYGDHEIEVCPNQRKLLRQRDGFRQILIQP
jgi:hypothetical protein